MKITQYLKQAAVFEARTGEDDWGKQLFTDPTNIKVRRTIKHKLLKTKAGHELIAVTQYMTEQPIKIGDRLDGQEIQGAEEIVDLSGKIIGYNAFPTPPTGYASSGG